MCVRKIDVKLCEYYVAFFCCFITVLRTGGQNATWQASGRWNGMPGMAVKLTFVLREMNGGMGKCGRTTHFAATFASNDTEGWVRVA